MTIRPVQSIVSSFGSEAFEFRLPRDARAPLGRVRRRAPRRTLPIPPQAYRDGPDTERYAIPHPARLRTEVSASWRLYTFRKSVSEIFGFGIAYDDQRATAPFSETPRMRNGSRIFSQGIAAETGGRRHAPRAAGNTYHHQSRCCPVSTGPAFAAMQSLPSIPGTRTKRPIRWRTLNAQSRHLPSRHACPTCSGFDDRQKSLQSINPTPP